MLSILTSSHPTDHDRQESGQFFAVATGDQPPTTTSISAVAATSDYSSNNSPTTGGASSPTTTPSGGGGAADHVRQPTNQITDEEEEEAAASAAVDGEEKRRRKISETDVAASASINCPFCNVLLLEPKYLQRHFQEAHGLDENRIRQEQTDYASHMISNGGVVSANNGFSEIFNNSIIMENIFNSTTAKTNNFNENEKNGENNNNFDCKSCNGSFPSEIELWAHRRSAHSQGVSNGNGAVPPPRPTLSTESKNKIFNPEAYCDLCDKEFCNKYFLKTHKANKHGVYGGCPGAGDDPSPASMVLPPGVVKNAGSATTTPTANGSAASIESQVQLAQNRLASILDAAAAAAVASDTPPLKQTEMDGGGIENGEITLPPDEASAAASLFQNFPANFGSNLYLQSLESSPCPFCHQVFANAFLLQSHIFTFHSMGALSPTSTNTVNPAALYALMNASSSASFNPFLAQQLKMFTPDHFSMFSGLPTTTSAQTSVSFSGGVGGQIHDLPSFGGLDLPLVDEAKRQKTPPQKGAAAVNDQSENAALGTTTSATAALQYAAATSNVHHNAQKSGATTAKQSQQQNAAAAAAEAFCDLCRKVFCNKYFLRTHKLNKHGISQGGDAGAETGNGSPNGIHRKRAYNKTGQYSQVGQQEFGAKVKIESEATNGLSQKDEESSNVSHENDENTSINGILDLALFSVDSNEAKRRRLMPQVSNDYGALNFSSNGSEGRTTGSSTVNAAAAVRPVDLDAYCDICCKEFCSKYFLKQHKFKIHGVVPDWSPVQNRTSPGNAVADFTAKSQDFENQEHKYLTKLNTSNGVGGDSSDVSAAPKTSTSGGGARHFPSTSKNFCDICNKEVCNKYYIRTHMLKMHGVIIDENKTIIGSINNVFDEKSKSFRCDICGKEMPNKHQLRNHIHLMHMSGNSSFFDPSNQTMSDQDDYHLKIQEESFEKSPNSKSQIPALVNTETRNNRRFKNVSRWLKNDHLSSSGDLQQQQQQSSPNGDADVRVCEYCGLECDDRIELQLHVIDAHQQEVNGAAEQTALDAICSLKSKNIDSKDQHCDDAEATLPSSVIIQNVETTAADGSLNLTRRFSRIDETIDRIVAAKEISAAAAAAGSTTTTPSSRAANKTSGASTLAVSATPRQPSAAATTAAANHHLPMVARNDLGAKMYKCSYCNYYTRWISNLSTHEKRHNAGVALTLDRNDRPFVCRICLRAYRYAHSLKRHMDVHRLSSLGMQIQMMAQAQSLPNLLQSPVVASLHSSPVRADNLSSTTKSQCFAAEEKRSPSRSTPIETASSSSAKNFATSTSNSPQKIAYVCSFCDKQFRNRELYRMHLYIIHKTSPPKAFRQQQQSPITTVRKNSPAKKAISTYNCKICGLSTKIYHVLRDHMEKEHGTVPRITINNGSGSPATGAKKDANDYCNSPLNLKTNSNAAAASVTDGDATYPPPLSSAPISLVVKSSLPAPNSRRAFASAAGTDVDRFVESARAKKGSVSPTSDSSENDKPGSLAPAPQPYIMQAFFIKETSSPLTSEMSSPFVPGVVYLPVLRHLDAPFDAKFSLFPVNRDDLSPVDSQLENEVQKNFHL